MKKTNKIVLLILPVMVISLAFFLYYNTKKDIGKAAVESIKIYNDIKLDLEKKNINIVDTIVNETDKSLDSIKQKKIKN